MGTRTKPVPALAKDPADLERQAKEAEDAAGELARRAHELGDDTIDPGEVDEHKRRAVRLRFEARTARAKAARRAEAARLEGLAVLHEDITAYAASAGPAGLNRALARIRSAAESFRGGIDEHNQALAAFRARAAELGAGPPAPGGARSADGCVAISGDAVMAGAVKLVRLTGLDDLPGKAAAGEPAAVPATSLVAAPRARPPVVLYHIRAGSFVERDSVDFEGFEYQRDLGEIVQLSADEVDRYLAGENIGLAAIKQRAAGQIAAAAAAETARRAELRRTGVPA